jgi:transposase
VATWRGFVYVAFVIDVFARRIVGWRVSASLRDRLRPRCARAGDLRPRGAGVDRTWCITAIAARSICRCATPTARRGRHRAVRRQSRRFVRQRPRRIDHRPLQDGGDSTERDRGAISRPSNSRRSTWVDWFNTRRLLEPIGYVPPAEYEAQYYEQKTNRRDARKLVELGRAGLLTAVRPPTPEEEAVRDLCRARDDAREDLQRCRHRLGKLLLRRGLHYAGRNWTRGHRQWIAGLQWTHAAERAVVDDYLLAIDHTQGRLAELDAQLAATAESAPYREPVGWLRCFAGHRHVDGDDHFGRAARFPSVSHPARLDVLSRAWCRAKPRAASAIGEGALPKRATPLVRRVLIETSWHYQHRPSVGPGLAARRRGQPARVIAIADKAQQRLCRRFRRLTGDHKPPAKVVVAVARELTGFLWAALQPAPAN